jgi:hypothetical protein
MQIFIDMSMSRKLIIRITDQQYRSISNCILLEQDGKPMMTKSSLIRQILNEYFDKNCHIGGKKSKTQDTMDSKDTTPNKLKSINKKKDVLELSLF